MLSWDKLLLFALLFSISIVGYSQSKTDENINNLFIKLKVKPNTTQKVDDLIDLYKKSKNNDEIINEALKVAQKIYYLKGIGVCFDRKGYTARKNHNFGTSIEYHKRALNFLSKTQDTLALIKCLNNLGVTYRKLNLEKEAFQFYFQALDVSEKIKHSKRDAFYG